jgi:hypothetical protein
MFANIFSSTLRANGTPQKRGAPQFYVRILYLKIWRYFMTAEEQNTNEETTSDWGHRPIKTASIQQIEEAFSKALGELTGMAYKVNINKLDLNRGLNAWLSDSSYIELELSRPQSNEILPF